ncbi:ATP-binding cassette domain-containing protein [Enterococcus sp. LJL98]
MKLNPILNVWHFSASFEMFQNSRQPIEKEVIKDLTLNVYQGEIVAVVGQSGSGKSILAHGIFGVLPANAKVKGKLFYEDVPLNEQNQKALRGEEMVLIPQSIDYLDPLLTVKKQVLGLHEQAAAYQKMQRLFKQLGLPQAVEECYPHQLSGGMIRRVLFATALLGEPHLIVADEPTPGMELSQATAALQILREEADRGAGVLLITHDLDLALEVANRVVIFYEGETIESMSVEHFLAGPENFKHDYSQALWRAMPQHDFINWQQEA